MRNLRSGKLRLPGSLRRHLKDIHPWVIVALGLLIVVLSALAPEFLTVTNLTNVLLQVSVLVPVTAGMTLVLIDGQIDLSVASNIAFTGIVVALLLRGGMPVPAAIALGLAVGLVIGLLNGLMVAYVGVNSFMVTLAMLSILRGLALTLVSVTGRGTGAGIGGLPESFSVIGAGRLGFLPIPVLIAVVVLVGVQYFLVETRLGRHIFAVGTSSEAATLFGLPVRRITLAAFAMSGVLASVSAIVLTSRLTVANPVVWTGWELIIITGVVIGGTSLFGGEGSMIGSGLGALLIGVITNGFNIVGINPFLVQLFTGLLIIAVVMLDRLRIYRQRA